MTQKHNTKQTHDIARTVLAKIKDEHIEPKASWHFRLKNIGMWVGGIGAMLVGGSALSALFFGVRNAEWDAYGATHGTFIGFFFTTLPYLWILLGIVFVFLAYEGIRHTKRGYRHRVAVLVVGSLFISSFIGMGLYTVGVGYAFDSAAGRLPFHKGTLEQKIERWVQPERGLLAGTIEQDEGAYVLTAFDESVWNITYERLTPRDEVVLNHFDDVRLIGIAESDSTFFVCRVLPWEVRGVRPPRGDISQKMDMIHESLQRERNFREMRSTKCRGLQPLQKLERVDTSK